jgi:hypothetical protein
MLNVGFLYNSSPDLRPYDGESLCSVSYFLLGIGSDLSTTTIRDSFSRQCQQHPDRSDISQPEYKVRSKKYELHDNLSENYEMNQ